ncbi:MAG: UDP-N-acetylmuramoyl-L-alanine--D-glutamate ligase [Candidatus Peribacteria bacterium]|nr:UDP-N-acetylmuramoyl-L-alanine--D-glutamate ligase [Candidatus Peribacteria bacterium]
MLDKNLEENYLKNLHTYDVIFKSSGIPYFPEILEVSEKVITQVQFFFFHYTGNVIAITASKGKTTMTSLAYELLKNAGYNVKVVGNIGKPVLEEINFDETYDFVVIELSSYMLQTLKKQNTISILGSLFPDHLDRHRGMDSYIKAKLNILEGSETNIIFSSTLNMLASQADKASLVSTGHTILCGKMTPYDRNDDSFLLRGKPIFPLSDIQLLGEHNLRNMSAIVALADLLDIPTPILHETIKHFQPVRHRLQNVGTFKGITFYDDAISTTPDSTIAALDALGNKVETIFLGGLDRGYDFQPLVERIKKSQIKHIVFFPKSGQKIEQLL